MPLLLLLALSCAPKAQVRALQAENAALNAQLQAERAQAQATAAELNATSYALEECRSSTRSGLAPTHSTGDEAAAQALYKAAAEAVDQGRSADAQALLEELLRDHPSSRPASRSQRMLRELQIIGQAAPPLAVDHWLQGDRAAWGRVTVVVFFEVWCPHCRREVPQLQERYEALSGRGLEVMALTRLTKSGTEAGTLEFMAESGLSYPVAVETGSMTEAFVVSGIPAAAVVKDGEIVWRGHPAKLDWDWVAGLL